MTATGGEGLLLGDHPGRQDRQGRHVEEAEPDARDPARSSALIAAEQATARHGAHLVIQLRPADTSAAVAEPDELDASGSGVAAAAVRGSIDGVPSSHCLAAGDGATAKAMRISPSGSDAAIRPVGRRS